MSDHVPAASLAASAESAPRADSRSLAALPAGAPTGATPADSASDAYGVWFERGVWLAVLLGCAVAISPNTVDPDLWGHVRYGEDFFRSGLAETATYTFTAPNYPWINHENLSEILLAAGMNLVGPIGLLVLKCALGVLLATLIIRRALSQGVGMFLASGLALLVAYNLAYHWSLRPQLLSYTLFACELALLSYAFSGWEGGWWLPWPRAAAAQQPARKLEYSSRRLKTLWLMAPLMCLWVNGHGGFLAGYFFFVAYLGCRGLEAWCVKGWAAAGLLRRFALMAFVAGLAVCVNPYGPNLLTWIAHDLYWPRPEIVEWWPPKMFNWAALNTWLLLGTIVLGMLFTRKTRDFTQVALLLLVFWQAFTHQRHLSFLTILVGWWLPAHVASALGRWAPITPSVHAAPRWSPTGRWLAAAGLCVTYVALGVKLHHRLGDLPVSRAAWPVSAFEYMAEHKFQGKLVCTFNWAQYALAAFNPTDRAQPGLLLSCDGRLRTCYPQEVIDMHFDFVLGEGGPKHRFRSPHSPPFNPRAGVEFGKPDLVLICRKQQHSTSIMNLFLSDWTLLYQDELSQLWGRKEKYDDPRAADYIPPARRVIGDAKQEGVVRWPAFPPQAPGRAARA